MSIDVEQLRARAEKSLDDFGPSAETAELFRVLVRTDPDHALTWYNRGDSLRSIGRFREAQEALLAARELMPKSNLFIVDTRLALVFSKSGSPADAEKWFRLATSSTDCPGWVWLLRADNLMRMESSKLARECLNTARLRGEVDLEELLLNEALIDRYLGNYEEAARGAEEALKLDPDYQPAKDFLESLRGAAAAKSDATGMLNP